MSEKDYGNYFVEQEVVILENLEELFFFSKKKKIGILRIYSWKFSRNLTGQTFNMIKKLWGELERKEIGKIIKFQIKFRIIFGKILKRWKQIW